MKCGVKEEDIERKILESSDEGKKEWEEELEGEERREIDK